MSSDEAIAARVRELAGIRAGTEPADDRIVAAVKGFADAFNYWYGRVMRGSVPLYRTRLIGRINPLIRRMEHQGGDCPSFAERVVGDYARRNYVTAGGWAIERIPPMLNPNFKKSGSRGIDLEKSLPGSNEHSIYILKSGTVTRNSDIVSTLKKHARGAEKLLRQSNSQARVTMNYVVSIGKTSTTFEDGINRPSSAGFWAEVTELPESEAVALILAIAGEAGRLVEHDASADIGALEVLVRTYLGQPSDPKEVDWEFLGIRLFQPKAAWEAEDKRRHVAAWEAMTATGYVVTRKTAAKAAAATGGSKEGLKGDELIGEAPPEVKALITPKTPKRPSAKRPRKKQ
jgi:hypothetical protein